MVCSPGKGNLEWPRLVIRRRKSYPYTGAAAVKPLRILAGGPWRQGDIMFRWLSRFRDLDEPLRNQLLHLSGTNGRDATGPFYRTRRPGIVLLLLGGAAALLVTLVLCWPSIAHMEYAAVLQSILVAGAAFLF